MEYHSGPGRSAIVTILGATTPRARRGWEGLLVPRFRLRFRTNMIAIAALAVLLGVMPALDRYRLYNRLIDSLG
jgi:hypothetical protein